MNPTAFILALSLASCAPTPPAWQDKPSPLDTLAVPEHRPEAEGRFGPFGTAPASHRNFTGSP